MKLKPYDTKVIKIDPIYPDPEIIQKAVTLLQKGEIIAFPTETVYGLGADATNDNAVKKIFEAKSRPSDNPLIVHVVDIEMMQQYSVEIPPIAYELAENFWPGPLTLVLKRSSHISSLVTKELPTVAMRAPSHPIAQKLIATLNKPIAAPSANISGRPSPTTAKHVFDDLKGKIPLILDGGSCAVGVESTVVSLVTDPPILLRPGGVTIEQLRKFIPEIQMKTDSEISKLSPGMRYRHYSPKTPIVLLKDFENESVLDNFLKKENDDYILLCTHPEHNHSNEIKYRLMGKTLKEIQKNLFENFRMLDELVVKTAYIEETEETEQGLAIMNRVKKAAFDSISLSEMSQ